MKCVKTHSLRAKYFSRRTRRREKWIKPYSRPAGRELCEAILTGAAAGNPAAVLFFVDILLLGSYNNVLGRNSVKTLKIKD